VQAGRRGGFGAVIGLDRGHRAAALSANGADVVVTDLTMIPVVAAPVTGHRPGSLPSALDHVPAIVRRAAGRPLGVFLDYDGTLTPIVSRPDLAVLPPATREALRELATRCTVAIVSGRDLADVQRLVDVTELFYSGSHGFDIAAPDGGRREHPRGADYLPALDAAQALLQERLAPVPGALVERKRFSLAAHFRLVGESDVPRVREAVDDALAERPQLRLAHGKMVFELRPRIEWHKGKAVRWLVEVIRDAGGGPLTPLYIGDDVTDEDALEEIRADGIGVFVGESDRQTAAHYRLADPTEVQRLLVRITEALPEGGDHV
jgi:alpha,alpha-trehalase